MDTTKNVIEAHLSTGKTIPLRQTEAKSGNKYWGTLKAKKDGSKVFSQFGVNVPTDLVGNPTKIESIRVDGVGTVKVTHDVTAPFVNKTTKKVSPGGKKRASAEKEFTSSDGEKWVFSFRATIVSDDVVNIQSSIRRQSGGRGSFGPQVQAAL